MKFTKIFLFTLLAFFFIGINSTFAYTVYSSTDVVVTEPAGTWSIADCPTAAGSSASTITATCSNTNCTGTKPSDKSCSAVPEVGTWSIDDCPTTAGTAASTITATCSNTNCPASSKPASKSCSAVPATTTSCLSPLTQNVTVSCDVNANGDTATSGNVTRSQTKSDYPGCTFGSPVTSSNSTYVSDNCVYPTAPTSCTTPLTKTVTVQCDANANGDTATSGNVTRSQTKSDYPGCTFGSPVTVNNSTYVSDNCVYPIVPTCGAPLTQTVSVQCDLNSNQDAATSGSVTRSQTKSDYPGCTFGSPVTSSNSTYVSDNCVYPAIVGDKLDGVWSMWTPARSDVCGASGTQNRVCVYPNPSNKGSYCPSDADGLALTKDYVNTDCPVVTPPVITIVVPPKPVDPSVPVDPSKPVDPLNPPSSSGSTKVIVDGGKIPYNGKITMTWTEENIASCTCTYKDSTGKTVNCPNFNGTPYSPPALKKATLFTLSCLGKIWGSVNVTKEVLVNDINANYTEN
ncbi:MAG: hypothetical protein NTV03_03185 [Candidatus Nomurabacteria bacterium]|nr:hypothetical protein [Candidatus Nomurabacteria bacterium]